MNCVAFLDRAAGVLDGSLSVEDRDAAMLHLAACADCRALLASLEAADDPGLTEAILERTSGPACGTARSRLCDRADGALGFLDAELVDGHVDHCPDCGGLARALARLRDDLPRLAAIDPGPGFVEAVLARTSRRPRRAPLSARWAAAAARLLERPRIALEGAFLAAIVVGLPLAASPAPLTAGPKLALTSARGAVNDLEARVRVGARSAWATSQAFAVESSIRLRSGTFTRLGASRQRGDANAQETTR